MPCPGHQGLVVSGLEANPSAAVGTLPQTGRGAPRDFEEKAKAMTVSAGSYGSLRGHWSRVSATCSFRWSDGAGRGDGEPCEEVVCRRSRPGAW